MERPSHLMIRSDRFPRAVAAIWATLAIEAVVIYAIATGLTIGNFRFYPHIVQIDFFKTLPPPPRPIVVPQLKLVEPPTPIVPPPEIQIQPPKPPPRITVAKESRRPEPPVYVQVTAPPVPPPPRRIAGITAPVQIGVSHGCERQYPPVALRLAQQGMTTLSFTVNPDGSVSGVGVARSSGHEMLDEAAIRCASSWRYRPALSDGHPVAASWTANVQWKLHNGSTRA